MRDFRASPNIRFCSIKDFRELCHAVGAKMEQAVALNAWGGRMRLKMPWWSGNLFGEQAVFLPSGAELTIYAFITASWIARQWRTRFGRDVTNCFNGVSMS